MTIAAREEALYAQRVNLQALTPVGEPLLVADAVAQNPTVFASVALSSSVSGLFAYRTPAQNSRELVWFQREGRQTGTLGTPSQFVGDPRLSPDGRTVAVERRVDGNADVWRLRSFLFDPAQPTTPHPTASAS